MAQPSSSHRDHRTERTDRSERDRGTEREDRQRERERAERRAERESRSSRSHHHHRTVSSTTLLLVLSLVLAVLAVMLSLPSGGLPAMGGTEETTEGTPNTKAAWGILTPKRSHELVRRETDVAKREAEVARREAEVLAGAPGGVLPPTPAPAPVMAAPMACPLCPTVITPEPFTVIKEVVKETEALAQPGWFDESKMRFQDILDRELKIADREREIGRREEQVNRREHDASRRETWIMEQLVAIGNEEQPLVEEDVYYDTPRAAGRRTPKYLPIEQELPPLIYTETAIATEFKTVTHTQHHTHTMPSHTVTVPAPANTRVAHIPTPEPHTLSWSTAHPRTTSVQIVHEQIVEMEPEPVVVDVVEEKQTHTVVRGRAPRPTPKRWW